jgi:hypothetical protein
MPMGMEHFHTDHIRPEITRRTRPVVLEIGVERGNHTRRVLSAVRERGGLLIAIDPKPKWKIRALLRLLPFARLLQQPSLDALPELISRNVRVDIALVDGDHNYYTVLHELELLDRLLAPDGVIFLHDVGWPYGRRDLYYVPERIPAEWRHPYAHKGMVRGQSELAEEGGIHPQGANALHEGGPRNGVLTAVEDFVARAPERWSLEVRDEEFGLGILRRRG